MNAAQEPSDDDIEAEASRVFPWAFPPDSDRERLIAVVDAHPRYWTASKLADRFEITFDEKVDPDLRIHHIPCFDRPKHQVDAFLKQRQRDRDAEQKRLHWKFEKKKPRLYATFRREPALCWRGCRPMGDGRTSSTSSTGSASGSSAYSESAPCRNLRGWPTGLSAKPSSCRPRTRQDRRRRTKRRPQSLSGHFQISDFVRSHPPRRSARSMTPTPSRPCMDMFLS